ncbi:MAG: hypothetical protein AB1560_05305 [Pseudomonadota bacterium]
MLIDHNILSSSFLHYLGSDVCDSGDSLNTWRAVPHLPRLAAVYAAKKRLVNARIKSVGFQPYRSRAILIQDNHA